MNAHDTIKKIIEQLKGTDGVQALVLGGSRARGTGHAHSDIDIGVYYDGSKRLDTAGIRRTGTVLDDDRRDDIITEIGEWGPWINGGGWLKVDGWPVDFLYRDLQKVSKMMDQCLAGEITIDYQPGHPHGFVNAVYAAEIALCQVLWDPHGLVGELKARMSPYPDGMKQGIIQKFGWEADFSFGGAKKGIYKKDLSYIAGHCFRAVSCLNQVLFALNEVYWMNEKGATAIADSFAMVPRQYASRVNEVINLITEEQADLEQGLTILQDLIQETDWLIKRAGGAL